MLSQAETPPTFLVHCRGTHQESRPRQVERTDCQGRRYTDTEYDNEIVTDFDFTIEHEIPPRAIEWTVGDGEPAYRGRMYREVGTPGETTKVDAATVKSFEAWVNKRRSGGIPPWVAEEQLANFPGGASVLIASTPLDPPGRCDSGRTTIAKVEWSLKNLYTERCGH